MVKSILFSFLFLLLIACSDEEQKTTPGNSVESEAQATVAQAAHAVAQQSVDYKLVFFLNPAGGPCRMQNTILTEMAGELNGKVEIQYVKTTVPGDRDIFYHYGIRALPTLLLADANGREIKRMAPGVRNVDDIRLLIQSIPQS